MNSFTPICHCVDIISPELGKLFTCGNLYKVHDKNAAEHLKTEASEQFDREFILIHVFPHSGKT